MGSVIPATLIIISTALAYHYTRVERLETELEMAKERLEQSEAKYECSLFPGCLTDTVYLGDVR